MFTFVWVIILFVNEVYQVRLCLSDHCMTRIMVNTVVSPQIKTHKTKNRQWNAACLSNIIL
ncbi:hypothetical protein ACVBE9_08705 [Eionea flava]